MRTPWRASVQRIQPLQKATDLPDISSDTDTPGQATRGIPDLPIRYAEALLLVRFASEYKAAGAALRRVARFSVSLVEEVAYKARREWGQAIQERQMRCATLGLRACPTFDLSRWLSS